MSVPHVQELNSQHEYLVREVALHCTALHCTALNDLHIAHCSCNIITTLLICPSTQESVLRGNLYISPCVANKKKLCSTQPKSSKNNTLPFVARTRVVLH